MHRAAYYEEWKNRPGKREALAAYQKIYRKKHKQKLRAYLTEKRRHYQAEEYAVWVSRFGPNCWICKMPPESGARLFKDHCRLTGQARGLAHRDCNWAIGQIHEDPTLAAHMLEAAKRCEALKATSSVRGDFPYAPQLRPPKRKKKGHREGG